MTAPTTALAEALQRAYVETRKAWAEEIGRPYLEHIPDTLGVIVLEPAEDLE